MSWLPEFDPIGTEGGIISFFTKAPWRSLCFVGQLTTIGGALMWAGVFEASRWWSPLLIGPGLGFLWVAYLLGREWGRAR